MASRHYRRRHRRLYGIPPHRRPPTRTMDPRLHSLHLRSHCVHLAKRRCHSTPTNLPTYAIHSFSTTSHRSHYNPVSYTEYSAITTIYCCTTHSNTNYSPSDSSNSRFHLLSNSRTVSPSFNTRSCVFPSTQTRIYCSIPTNSYRKTSNSSTN